MNKEELDILETRLQERGYRKFTSALSSNESWGWFKTIRKTDNEDGNNSDNGCLVEYRVWDYTSYLRPEGPVNLKPYGVDVLLLMSGSSRVDLMMTSCNIDIDYVEDIATKFFDFCKENKLDIDPNYHLRDEEM